MTPVEFDSPDVVLDPDAQTVGQARARVREAAADGCDCPVCGQLVRVYRRRLSSVPARFVQALYVEHGVEFGSGKRLIDSRLGDIATQGGYLTLGWCWGLIEAEVSVRGSRTGRWRVTGLGEQWLRGFTRVRDTVLLYDGAVIGREGDWVSVRDALGTHFDLDALMARTGRTGETLSLFEVAA